jgi:hypothetical protein
MKFPSAQLSQALRAELQVRQPVGLQVSQVPAGAVVVVNLLSSGQVKQH